MGGDLEDRVGRRIQDRAAGPLMLLAQLGDDLGPRGGPVAERREPDDRGKALDDLEWKTLRVGRKGHLGDHPDHLPMPGDGVLAF